MGTYSARPTGSRARRAGRTALLVLAIAFALFDIGLLAWAVQAIGF